MTEGGGHDREAQEGQHDLKTTSHNKNEKARLSFCHSLSFPTLLIGNPAVCLFRRRQRSHLWIPAKNCGNDRGGARE